MNTPFTQNVHFPGAEDILVKAGSPNGDQLWKLNTLRDTQT
jgi:hypothetical protein